MSRTGPQVIATVSGHGFGHLSITAPVLNELGRRLPDCQLVVISGLPRPRLARRIHHPFRHLHTALDFGVRMDRELRTLVRETADAYRGVHRHWDTVVEREAGVLRSLRGDLLFANVSYLSIAAAARADVPAVAACPLNWADVFNHYCANTADAATIHRQMVDAYNAAAVFFQPEPSMPMPSIEHRRRVGPVAEIGRDRRHEILTRLGRPPDTRLVLVALGGHDWRIPVSRWPDDTGLVWLVEDTWNLNHPQVQPFSGLGVPFLDLMASCDLLIGKPGYGSFVEAACAGVPVLFLRRPEWPEQPYLIDWLNSHGRCAELHPGDLSNGRVLDLTESLLGRAAPPPLAPTGVGEIVDALLERLAPHCT